MGKLNVRVKQLHEAMKADVKCSSGAGLVLDYGCPFFLPIYPGNKLKTSPFWLWCIGQYRINGNRDKGIPSMWKVV